MFRALVLAPFFVSAEPAANYVLTGVDSGNFNFLCLEDNCQHTIRECAKGEGSGGQECEERLSCVKKETFDGCYEGVKWDELAHAEVKVFDCAKENACMNFKTPGMSLLETERIKRKLPTAKEAMVYEGDLNLLKSKAGLAKVMSTLIGATELQKKHNAFLGEAKHAIMSNRLMMKQTMEDEKLAPEDKKHMMSLLQRDVQDIQASIHEHVDALKKAQEEDEAHASSFAEIRPSSMSEQEQGSGMTAEVTQGMQDTLHKWEQGIEIPSLIHPANEDESSEMLEKAEMKKKFEDNFRQSFRESVLENQKHATEVDAAGNLRQQE